MIFTRGKKCVTTAIRKTAGGTVETVLIVGSSESDCTRHAGRSIARAMESLDGDVSWNIGCGNAITVSRHTDEYNEGDRHIHSRLVTVSERGRRIEHDPRRRANPAWEGLSECEVCHRRLASIRGIYGTAAGRIMLACRECRKIVKMANDISARRGAGGSGNGSGGSSAAATATAAASAAAPAG